MHASKQANNNSSNAKGWRTQRCLFPSLCHSGCFSVAVASAAATDIYIYMCVCVFGVVVVLVIHFFFFSGVNRPMCTFFLSRYPTSEGAFLCCCASCGMPSWPSFAKRKIKRKRTPRSNKEISSAWLNTNSYAIWTSCWDWSTKARFNLIKKKKTRTSVELRRCLPLVHSVSSFFFSVLFR